MNNGFIKLHRSILDWDWWSDQNTFRVFIFLLLKANWKDGNHKGENVPRGSLVTGRKAIAEATGLSERSVRTALEHLKSTNEVTIKTMPKYSVITIKNYDKYQVTYQQIDQQPTSNRPATDHNRRKKEYKNIKNDNSARARKPSTWSNIESEKQKRERDEFLEDFERHIVGG